ncbi:hypothetical protein DFH07DRAFT_144471 [Mycena maculata]|uniref:Secreted protein n=1 Tax=Mycena maculata TaxID=230809 RepID=A0AAD7I142_9AGAR|nr:hypothetical protein DFH07DRAFT_144471 [Mycena maculata]
MIRIWRWVHGLHAAISFPACSSGFRLAPFPLRRRPTSPSTRKEPFGVGVPLRPCSAICRPGEGRGMAAAVLLSGSVNTQVFRDEAFCRVPDIFGQLLRVNLPLRRRRLIVSFRAQFPFKEAWKISAFSCPHKFHRCGQKIPCIVVSRPQPTLCPLYPDPGAGRSKEDYISVGTRALDPF